MRRRSTGAMAGMREALSGAAIRALAGLHDAGEAFLARVTGQDGGDHFDTTGGRDVWVNVVDELTGQPVQARLHIPGNILFSVPEDDDTCMVLRPRDASGPGMSYAFHGDGGAQDRFPAWFGTKNGLYTRRVLRLESAADHTEIECAGGKQIRLGPAATKGVARTDDAVTLEPDIVTWLTGLAAAATFPDPFPASQHAHVSGGSAKVTAED